MRNKGMVELWVGIFLLIAIAGIIFLAFQVSGLTQKSVSQGYVVTANFDNIGGLKVRAPIEVGGVVIGRVIDIGLDAQSYQAVTTLLIYNQYPMPTDSSASIFTQGLLGSNYVSITPGYAETSLKTGDTIQHTTSALILEQLIGQFLFNTKKS